LFQLTKTLRRLHSAKKLEYCDQKSSLENLVNLIADNKLPFDSINFKKICTQIRLLLPKDRIKYISKKGSQITIQFPEREVKITKKEYDYYQGYINNNEILRKTFGLSPLKQKEPITSSGKNLQYFPVITLPFNFPLQELINKGAQSFILLNNNNLGSNETNPQNAYAGAALTDQRDDHQNGVFNTMFLVNDDGKLQ